MATVAEIQRAGLVKVDGYDHYYRIDKEHKDLAYARCYVFMTTYRTEESASDIERQYRVLKRTEYVYLTDEEAQHYQVTFFKESEAYFAASLPSHLNGPLNIENHVSGREDMTIVHVIDAHNQQVAEKLGLPTTYAASVAEGDTQSDWACYLQAKDATYER